MAEPIAIVGMAAIFPGAGDAATFWRNILEGVDAITEVPPHRWDPVFHDPTARRPDRFPVRRGGFVDEHAVFDALAFGVMPVAALGAEPDQLLALQVAAAALRDAGYDRRPLPRRRAGVILGRGNYVGPGTTRLEQRVRTAEQLVTTLRDLFPDLPEERIEAVREAFQARLGPYGPDTAIGLVPNLTASRIANRLDIQGPAYTLDAACASALLALDHAARELRSGRCDLVLAGGVHLTHDVAFWSVFSQLGALSPTGRIRPFHQEADGLLIGEGLGILVLRRAADALREGERIVALVDGVGVASDGRSGTLMAPRVEGQVLALTRAWEEAGLDRERLGLVEAHGTATPAGDAAELATLHAFFGRTGHPIGLGSVKSMIGHTMPAAGAAGLIKAALAVHHGVLPPTLHADRPREELEGSRFRLVDRPTPWEAEDRVAAVDAFGFGGIDAHAVLRNPAASALRPLSRTVHPVPRVEAGGRPPRPPLRLAAASTADLLAALETGRSGGRGPARLAVLDPTPARIARAREVVGRGRAWPGRGGVWFAPRGLLADGGRIAFLFPGVDANFQPRVEDVAGWLGVPLPPCADPSVEGDLERVGVGIIGVNRLLHRALGRLGLRPHALAGHSIGEWSAMIAGGCIPEEEVDAFIATLRPGTLEVPGVGFLAVGAGVEQARAACAGLEDVAISHDNCPHQVILCGRDEALAVAAQRLRREGVLARILPFRSGFHSPLFRDYLALHRDAIRRLGVQPPRIPIWSATTLEPYPDDPAGIRALFVRHLVQPVRFRELVERLADEGVRAYVQVGTGRLASFCNDTLRGRPHLALSANTPRRTGLEQLAEVAVALWVHGAEPDLAALWPGDAPPLLPASGHPPMKLDLGVPLVRLDEPLALPAAPETPLPAGPPHPVRDALQATLAATRAAAGEVARAWEGASAVPARASRTRRLSVPRMPWLADHCFFPQPEGWPVLADRFPVLPLTSAFHLATEAAGWVAPGRRVVALHGVRAWRWVAVEPPLDLEIVATRREPDRVDVELPGYFGATVELADAWPSPPPPDRGPLPGARPPPMRAERLYADRWMFHGPAFQGIEHLEAVGRDAIRGRLQVGAAPGALLDNAGQLLGLWVMATQPRDRLAMPIRVEHVRFFGPQPPPGETLTCTVRIRRIDRDAVVADIQLDHRGRCHARLEGWEDRRFETDERLWAVMRFPERHVLSSEREGWVRFDDPYRSGATREYLARRYLGAAERAALAGTERVDGAEAARRWLAGRVAAKDAVRVYLWSRGAGPLFPVEIETEGPAAGPLRVAAPGARDLRVGLHHVGRTVLAAVAPGEAPTLMAAAADDAPPDLAGRTAPGGTVRVVQDGDLLVAIREP